MDFLGMGTMEVLVILVVALIFLGPQRMVKAASQLGKAVRELRKASSQLTEELTRELAIDEDLKKLPAKPSLSPPPGTQSREQTAVPPATAPTQPPEVKR